MKQLLWVCLMILVAQASAHAGDSPAPIKVAFVLSDGATVIDFAGPWEVFQDTEATVPFELFTVAPSKAPIHTSGGRGITVTPDFTFGSAPMPDIVVIGAQRGGPGLSEWLRKIHSDGKVILSVC